MTGSGFQTWQLSAVAIIAAAWLAFATWMVIRGARARVQADIARNWGMRLRGLLSTAPAAYLVVGATGAASASDTLRGWLGLDAKIASLDDLAPNGDTGLTAASFDELKRGIERAAMSGTGGDGMLSTQAGRTLRYAYAAAPEDVAGAGGVALWFSDATKAEAEAARLTAELAQAVAERDGLRDIVRQAPIPIFWRDADFRLHSVNDAYVTAVGAASPEAAVAEGAELVADAAGRPATAAARAAVETGLPQRREQVAIAGGDRRVFELTDIALPSGGVAGFAIDVTPREEARFERDLLAAAQTETLDRLSAGVALFAADRSLAFFNRPFAAMGALDPLWLDERPEFDRVLERMRDGGRLPETRDFPDWRRERGGWFTSAEAFEEVWALPDSSLLRVIAQPHPSGGVLMILEDRTEQMRLASARDTVVRVQQTTLDNLHEAVAVFSADGRLQLHNRLYADFWSLRDADLAGNPHVDRLIDLADGRLVETERGPMIRDVIRQATAAQRRTGRSGRFEMTSGRMVDFAAVPLPDGNVLFTFLDVTDSQRIESALRDRNDALEAADRLKSAFVANISYELRTPLTAIGGFGELLAQGYAGALTAQQADYVGSIVKSSERLQLLINDILDLAINEAGELLLDVTTVDVSAVVASVAEMSREAVESRKLVLEVTVAEDTGEVDGDPRRLKQALFNIVGNAVRFTPTGGRIRIDASGDARGVRLVVSDTGIGVPAEEQAGVFERFRKGSNAGSQGVGLGLSLVRQFVELHGGTVDLASTLGQGTTVTVWLPRRQPAAHNAVSP